MQKLLQQREQFATRFSDFGKAALTASQCNDEKRYDDYDYRVEPADDTPADQEPTSWFVHRYSERGWDGVIKFT